MRIAKQIVFRYNGDPSAEEIDDMDGDKSVPEQGSFVERKGTKGMSAHGRSVFQDVGA
jgi:hypothetical protein